MPVTQRSYENVQRAPLHLLFWAIALLLVVLGLALDGPVFVWLVMPFFLAFVGLCFTHLTVRDGGDALEVTYGPVPLFRHRIAYGRMTGVERARSTWLDGWGIHWIPGRGWIYNIWGQECVRIGMGDASVRVGTDDREGLVRFLESKIAG